MPFTIMPLIAPKQKTVVQEDEDFPFIPVDGEKDEELQGHLSARISISNKMKGLKGQLAVHDGEIHSIVNECVFSETPKTLKNGYTAIGEGGESIQLQVKKSYLPITSDIRAQKDGTYAESGKNVASRKIIQLAEIFNVFAERDEDGNIVKYLANEDGTFNFPEGTFYYKDSIKVDPTKVEASRMGEFIQDVIELGEKYSQGNLNPVSEETTLQPESNEKFHKDRLSLGHKINILIHEIFQNISIKLENKK